MMMNTFYALIYTIGVSSLVKSLLKCFAYVLILLLSYYWKCYQFLSDWNKINFYKINGTPVNNFQKILKPVMFMMSLKLS